jgi:phosphopantothenoylcysteine decarboxylase/phosphopantothenate--cysteine ligase
MKLLLGISGSIAAYKAPALVREFIKRGVEVRVVMSPSATKFASPLALQNLTKYPVAVEMFDETTQSSGSWHIHLARWCDAMLIAPCSAATLGKTAHGITDTALTLVALALPPEKKLYIAPAMDAEMWIHPATQRNVRTVQSDGATVIPPEEGELASGFHGIGRLPDVDTLVRIVLEEHVVESPVVQPPAAHQPVVNVPSRSAPTVLITAGPTHEPIDDVRYIANRSSGKMGFALAEASLRAGCKVVLVSGPVHLPTPNGVERVDVETAQQMYNAVMERQEEADVMILAAAVADFTPAVKHEGKLKKASLGEEMTLHLAQNPDILGTLGKRVKAQQALIGFALEAANYEEYGRKKLREKNCDMIVLNAANKPQSGFAGDDNTISLLWRDADKKEFPPMSKRECARVIVAEALQIHAQKAITAK